MAEAVYLLCTLTSVLIAILLFRGYARTNARLLFWTALCFIGLAVNNALLFIDKGLYPDVELWFLGINMSIWRGIAALVGLAMLLWGLIWDVD
jgi:hypothetical protein